MQRNLISSYISALAISILLLFASVPTFAQSKVKKVIAQADTIPLLRGVAISVDVFGAGQMLLGDYGQYEAALRINLKDKYFPVVELGLGKADAKDEGTNLHYKTSAPYVRIGMDWNLMKNKHDIYRLYGGLRYAFTSYKYDLTGPEMTDPIWGTTSPYEAKDVSCNYHWMEIHFGVDAKILGPIRMGWSVRYRCRIAHNNGELGNTWYVPGFGKQGNSRFGGTFNIAYEF